MAGIYIHVPFCKKACNYCDFHFSTKRDYQQKMVASMATEISRRAHEITTPIETIYFGGGTPSLLTKEQLQLLLNQVHTTFQVSKHAEITLEGNPDDMSMENLKIWYEAGINRLSVGIQSFNQQELDWMNRAHTAAESLKCIGLAKEIGFNSFSVDLIYGLPNLSNESWENTLAQALELGINHLSTYCLTIENKTVLENWVKKGKFIPMEDDKQAEQFLILTDFLKANNWDHYEISNSCKPGYRAKHNTAYWENKPYLGIGPSAHSFDGHNRKWNVANNPKYLRLISDRSETFETEVLSTADKINEYILTRLRTSMGVSLEELKNKWNYNFPHAEMQMIALWCEKQLMIKHNNILTLTTKGRLQADKLASELFIIN